MSKTFLTAIAAVGLIGFVAAYTMQTSNTFAGEPLVIGVDEHYVPFSYLDPETKTYQGFDVEFAKALCQELDVKCTIKPMPLQALFEAVKAGDMDVIVSGLGSTKARREFLDFSNPYYESRSFFIVNDPTISPVNKQDPKGLKFGVKAGSLQEQYLQKRYVPKGASVTSFKEYDEMVTALKAKTINAIFMDGWPGYALLRSHEGKDLLIGGHASENLEFGTEAKIAVRKAKGALVEPINQAIVRVKASGKYQAITVKYFLGVAQL